MASCLEANMQINPYARCCQKGQTMLTAVPQQDAGYLDEPQVVGGLLLIAHQDRSALREPAQRPLHHPPPRRVALLARGVVELLLADPADVRNVAALPHH